MPSISAPEVFLVIESASNIGDLLVETNQNVYPGTSGWICKNDGSARAYVKIVAVKGSDGVTVRRYPNDNPNSPPSYGRSDMSAFNTASHLCIPIQPVAIDPAFSKRTVS